MSQSESEIMPEEEWVTGDYGDFLDLTPEERAIVERRAELARLEREVIEAAKADLMAETRQENDHGIDRLIASRRRYRAAVIALLEFEKGLERPGSQ